MSAIASGENVFIGFPHQGRFVGKSAFDARDEKAAESYYRSLFQGKDIEFVSEVCAREKNSEKAGRHDAQLISCGWQANGKYAISYRFILRGPDEQPVPIALVWDVYLGFKAKVVEEVEASASILAP